MMEEELMPSNFYSINAQSWQELITTDRGFIMPEYQTALVSYAQEMLTKFILKQEPISGFDAFVENLRSMNLDKLLNVYESTYARVK